MLENFVRNVTAAANPARTWTAMEVSFRRICIKAKNARAKKRGVTTSLFRE